LASSTINVCMCGRVIQSSYLSASRRSPAKRSQPGLRRDKCHLTVLEVPGAPHDAAKREVEQLIVRMASGNRDWGYDRIAGAMANLGYLISDRTVGNVLRRNGLPPAPERKRTTRWWVLFV
jgi:hypothetical protein